MNKTQRRQMVKGEAFNSIMKIYHPKSTGGMIYNHYNDNDGSYSEQRDSKVRQIIEKYLKELDKINKDASS